MPRGLRTAADTVRRHRVLGGHWARTGAVGRILLSWPGVSWGEKGRAGRHEERRSQRAERWQVREDRCFPMAIAAATRT